MSEIISKDSLLALAGQWLASGRRLAGPTQVRPGQFMYTPVVAPDQLALGGFVRPANSIKEFLFPRHEKLYGYKLTGSGVDLVDWDVDATERLILGARPCDAASLPILDHVFNWDYKDDFYNRRRAATTIVTLACTEHDAQCFCTSVGLGPDADRGADAMLLAIEGGAFEVRCFTDKGRALFAGKTQISNLVATVPPGPDKKFSAPAIRDFLAKHFEHPVYAAETLRCLGCGACAYGCPTCHCFDIVDEGNAAGGCRAKNWDSCQFGLFTLHASGHNPRGNQAQRQRQRLQHKFRIYPEKFGEVLCTGCGACTRNCPVSLGVQNVLEAISAVAKD